MHKLDKELGIKKEKLLKKHDKMAEDRKAKGHPDLIFHQIARKLLQLSHQFISEVRHLLGRRTLFREALNFFRQRLVDYF